MTYLRDKLPHRNSRSLAVNHVLDNKKVSKLFKDYIQDANKSQSVHILDSIFINLADLKKSIEYITDKCELNVSDYIDCTSLGDLFSSIQNKDENDATYFIFTLPRIKDFIEQVLTEDDINYFDEKLKSIDKKNNDSAIHSIKNEKESLTKNRVQENKKFEEKCPR